MRRAAVLMAAAAAALGVCGCSGKGPTPAGLRLQREDLILVARALQSAEAPVAREVAAAKAAWPLVAHGVPRAGGPASRAPIRAAATAAARLRVPPLFAEAQSSALTGPASAIAGLFASYSGLALHGWQLIDASIQQIEHGLARAAAFARANVALYIESVYDGHFSLAHIGKKAMDGYRKLGGPPAFGTSLSQAEVNALAAFYSEAHARLHPHVAVRLGT